MKPIGLPGFEAKFDASDDPWSTWNSPDEVLKREAILHALGPGPLSRVLEVGAGNGSNSRAIAPRTLRLDATEATAKGTALVARAVGDFRPRARAAQLVVPAPPPRTLYDAVVIAELLYYLDVRAMSRLAHQVATRLRPGGKLVLAHHRISFYDFAQHAEGIHDRFLRQAKSSWKIRKVRQTGRWSVLACVSASKRAI